MQSATTGVRSASRADRRGPWTTISGRPIAALYTPEDIATLDYQRDLGDPGQFPYTRGLHPTGYRGKPWTMRQFAGFGTPEETNARYTQLLADGGTGLSVAFDLPTLMGRDPDHELSLGEVCALYFYSASDHAFFISHITRIEAEAPGVERSCAIPVDLLKPEQKHRVSLGGVREPSQGGGPEAPPSWRPTRFLDLETQVAWDEDTLVFSLEQPGGEGQLRLGSMPRPCGR
jgi:hypothetical protein